MRKLATLIFSFLISGSLCLGQTKPNSAYYLPKTFSKTSSWIKADEKRGGASNIDTSRNKIPVVVSNFNGFRIPAALTFFDHLTMIKKSDFYTFLHAKRIAILQYKKYFPYLIKFLSDTAKVELGNTDYSMIFKKDSPFLADTAINKKNLQTVAGRAACILNELTGETFAVVAPSTTMAELHQFQLLWVAWIKKLKK